MDKAGYKRERGYVWEKYGKKIETCHVADVKAALGLTNRVAHNRLDAKSKVKPCPQELWEIVEEAVRHVHSGKLNG